MQLEQDQPFKPILKSISPSSDSLNTQLRPLHVVFKNFIIILESDSSASSYENFQTLNLETHELKEGKIQGQVPGQIYHHGACLFNDNMILVNGKSYLHEEGPTLFLMTIIENTEERILEINSRIWFRRAGGLVYFTQMTPMFNYKGEIYKYGKQSFYQMKQISPRHFQPLHYLYVGFWKLDQETGEWKNWKTQEKITKKEQTGPQYASLAFVSDKFYLLQGGVLLG